LTSENDVFGGHLTLPKYKIVDCGAFCEVIFFYISPKNLLGDFFYSLNVKAHWNFAPPACAVTKNDSGQNFQCRALLCINFLFFNIYPAHLIILILLL